MVFQNYALYPHMDVAHNLSFALELAGVDKHEIGRRVAEAAGILNITHLLQRKPKELSGGQRQRVAIGRCIVREPSIFLFDEPLSNLDAKLRAHMRTELALLHERLGKTTIYVTHDQVEAMTLASRIVIFDKGIIQQVGAPSEVFNRPANLFVAGFIGMPSMNLLEGTVQSIDGRAVLSGPGFAFPVSGAAPAGKRLIAGVRPQSLHVASGQGALALHVDVVEYLGMESLLVGRLEGAGEGRVTAVLPGQRGDLMRQTVALEMDPAAMHVYDESTGQRLDL
jgi:ABC-type sugar transport system ATPase subunit